MHTQELCNNFLPNRRVQLFETYGPPGSGLIPDSEPEDPVVNFGSIKYNPASGNQDEEFIEIVNTNAYAVDLSGWRIAVSYTHLTLPTSDLV